MFGYRLETFYEQGDFSPDPYDRVNAVKLLADTLTATLRVEPVPWKVSYHTPEEVESA